MSLDGQVAIVTGGNSGVSRTMDHGRGRASGQHDERIRSQRTGHQGGRAPGCRPRDNAIGVDANLRKVASPADADGHSRHWAGPAGAHGQQRTSRHPDLRARHDEGDCARGLDPSGQSPPPTLEGGMGTVTRQAWIVLPSHNIVMLGARVPGRWPPHQRVDRGGSAEDECRQPFGGMAQHDDTGLFSPIGEVNPILASMVYTISVREHLIEPLG